MRVRLHRHPQGQAVIAWLIANYVRLIAATGRFELQVHPAAAELFHARRPLVAAFWHGRMLMIEPAWRALVRQLGVERPLQPYVMSSEHADGQLIARATDRLGIKSLSGSTKRAGGRGLLRLSLGALTEGNILVVTPDGPRGPAMHAKTGAAHLAIQAGVPILPITWASRHQRLLGSWDRFALPRPFDRGMFAFGAPLDLAKNEDARVASSRLETALNALTAEVDRAVGCRVMVPA